MAYSDTETITLEDVGAPELWVRYKRIGMLPYKEYRKYFENHRKFNVKQNTSPAQTLREVLDDVEAEFEIVTSLIEDWNLTDSNSVKLELPSNNKAAWEEVPGAYLAYIVNVIKNDPSGSNFLAKSAAENLKTIMKQLQEEGHQTPKDLGG